MLVLEYDASAHRAKYFRDVVEGKKQVAEHDY